MDRSWERGPDGRGFFFVGSCARRIMTCRLALRGDGCLDHCTMGLHTTDLQTGGLKDARDERHGHHARNVAMTPGLNARQPPRKVAAAASGKRYPREFALPNPIGTPVIVDARAVAMGDALARILRTQGHGVEARHEVNDADNQVDVLALSFAVRLRQALGGTVARLALSATCGETGSASWASRRPRAWEEER